MMPRYLVTYKKNKGYTTFMAIGWGSFSGFVEWAADNDYSIIYSREISETEYDVYRLCKIREI